MQEMPEDLARLQTLLERSIEQAGSFLRSSFEMPDHSLSAGQLVRYLQGLQVVSLATVTAKGEPRVAPIGALFYRGRFCIPTVATAARTSHIVRRPAVSLAYYQGVDLAIIVHGTAVVLAADHPEFAVLEEVHTAGGGQSPREWGEGIFLRVEPNVMYTYARYPEQFPE